MLWCGLPACSFEEGRLEACTTIAGSRLFASTVAEATEYLTSSAVSHAQTVESIP
jgi:hypothetical protein